MTKKPRPITEKRLENIALFYLERFASSSDNLRFILQRRCKKSSHPDDIPQDQQNKAIENIINRFERLGYLNDTLYAESLIPTLYRQGKSKTIIIQTLRQKRVPPFIIDQEIEKFYHEEESHDDYQAALVYAKKKKIGPYRPQESCSIDHKQYQKEMARMARRGFSFDIIKQILQDSSQENIPIDTEHDNTYDID